MPYVWLLFRECPEIPNEPWGIYFGDYDGDAVAFERDALVRSGHPRRDTRIVTLPTADQSAIDAYLAEINGEAFA